MAPKKKSGLIFLVLIISLTFSSAQATHRGAEAPWTGQGTADNPYRITNNADLLALTTGTDYYGDVFVMTADIDLTGESFTKAIIAPDGATTFTGVFNGNDHIIFNLTVDATGTGHDYLGLIGKVGSFAEVKNLAVENVAITGGTGSQNLGGLFGWIDNATVSECYSTGTLHGGVSALYVGGLAGVLSTGTILNCHSSVNVNGGASSQNVGGLIGIIAGGVGYCYASGSVSGTGMVGGFAGTTYTSPVSCYYLYPGGGPDNGVGIPYNDTQMRNPLNFVSWDFFAEATNGTAEIWQMDGYPVLGWQKPVGLREFALLGQFWMTANCTANPLCPTVDWFNDNTINVKDLRQLTLSWCDSRVQTDYYRIEDDFETGDFNALGWVHGAQADWVIDPNTVFAGNYSARSGPITHSQSSSLELTVDTTGFNDIVFNLKISSEPSDFLYFYIDDVQQPGLFYGQTDWFQVTFDVDPGIHTYKWKYAKDNSSTAPKDCAWIDNVRFIR